MQFLKKVVDPSNKCERILPRSALFAAIWQLVIAATDSLMENNTPPSWAELPAIRQFLTDMEENPLQSNPPPSTAVFPVIRHRTMIGADPWQAKAPPQLAEFPDIMQFSKRGSAEEQ